MIVKAKRELRQRMQGARRAILPEHHAATSAQICAHGRALIPRMWQRVRRAAQDADSPPVISGYMPIRGEADIRPLLQELAHEQMKVVLPVIPAAPDSALEFHLWHPEMALSGGAFDTQIPEMSGLMPEIPDILLVPLLAFDRRGGRLGYGKGYYDRSIAGILRKKPCITLGIAFAMQEVKGVPMEAHDHPLDWVITETGPVNCVYYRQCRSDK